MKERKKIGKQRKRDTREKDRSIRQTYKPRKDKERASNDFIYPFPRLMQLPIS